MASKAEFACRTILTWFDGNVCSDCQSRMMDGHVLTDSYDLSCRLMTEAHGMFKREIAVAPMREVVQV